MQHSIFSFFLEYYGKKSNTVFLCVLYHMMNFLSCFPYIFEVDQKGYGVSMLENIQKPSGYSLGNWLQVAVLDQSVVPCDPKHSLLNPTTLMVHCYSIWSHKKFLCFYSLDISKQFHLSFPYNGYAPVSFICAQFYYPFYQFFGFYRYLV